MATDIRSVAGFDVSRAWQLCLLSVATFVAKFEAYSFTPLQEAAQLRLSLTDNQIGILQGPVQWILVAFVIVPIGTMVDRFNRKRLLLWFSFAGALANILGGLSTTFTELLLSRLVIGTLTQAAWLTAFSLAADLYPPHQRGRAVMILCFGEALGMSSVFTIGGILLTHFDGEPNAWGAALVTMNALLLPLVTLLGCVVPRARSADAQGQAHNRMRLRDLRAFAAIIAVLATGRLVLWIGEIGAIVWATPMYLRKFALSPGAAGVTMTVILLASSTMGSIVAGVLNDRCLPRGGPRRALSAMTGVAVLLIPCSLFSLASTAWLATGMLFCFQLCGAIIGISSATLTTVSTPASVRGLVLSVLIFTGMLFGTAPAPVVVSLVAGLLPGPNSIATALSLVAVVASTLCAVIFLSGIRKFPAVAVVD